jgi:hypothetical protein
MGLLETPIAGPKDIRYGEKVRKELLKRKEEVLAYSTARVNGPRYDCHHKT